MKNKMTEAEEQEQKDIILLIRLAQRNDNLKMLSAFLFMVAFIEFVIIFTT